MRTLSRAEAEYLVDGAAILGVGGGGDPVKGLKSLIEQIEDGKKLRIAAVDDFKEEDLLASPYFVGSVAPTSEKKEHVKKTIKDPIASAVELLEAKLQKHLAGTVASEIGGGNTSTSLAIAAKLGIPMLDGDLMGRAGPELHQSTVHIFGLSMSPAAIVTDTGNRLVVDSYSSIDDYEAIARYTSVISGGHAAVVDTPLSREDASRCMIQGTISKCLELGKSRSEALQKGKDPVVSVTEKLRNGKVVFSGTVRNYTWKDERGFLLGEATLEGSDNWRGKKLKSWIMNEHIICWLDDRPRVISPDIIAFLDPSTGAAITNTNLKEGMPVKVVGASIDDVWRTPKGIELFGPRHFGFDFEYVPFEDIQES